MPAGIAPTPSDSPVGQQKKGAATSVAAIPFARASKWHIEQSNTQSGIALTGANSQIFNLPLASYGYLSAIFLTVQVSGGNVAATNTFFEDAPWSLIQQIQLSDVNGVPIYQLSGYQAFLAAKYGGYRPFSPDGIIAPDGGSSVAGGQNLNAPTGGYYQAPVATGGSGALATKFILPIFLEFGTDGLGCLPNMDASARYNLQVTVAGGVMTAASTGPYLTAVGTVTTNPTMSLTVEVLCRSQPPAQDMFGNQNSVSPPAVGTVQYWTSMTASGLANGANTIQLTRVGNLIRNHILVFRDTNGTRATAETGGTVPSLLEMDWDVGQRYIAALGTYRFWQAYTSYGFDVPKGVIVLPNTLDPDKLPFSEYGDEWMGTVGATKLTLRFSTTAGSGSLSVITNDIVPASSQVYAAPAMQLG